MASQQDLKQQIASVQNIEQVTRAMQMVAAARLRRAEQRIEELRPYASAIRRMTRKAVEAAQGLPDLPVLEEHEQEDRVALLLVSSDRGLAGPFNNQVVRIATRRERELRREGREIAWYASGSRGISTLQFRGEEIAASYQGFTDRPAYENAREIAEDLIAAYTDGHVDRVEIFYNHFISAMQQEEVRETLLPLQRADVLEEEDEDSGDEGEGEPRGLWLYEPEPGEILGRLVPDYVEISIFRALLESTASEHGARMTAMQQAANNAEDMIGDLQMEANRMRQAEITQELMEIVAGAEALS
jgi:F-type H+-transporting ATPase subunit gamma